MYKVLFNNIIFEKRCVPIITIMAKLKAQPGKESILAEECALLAQQVRKEEKGCLAYIPHVSLKDSSEIFFFEQYADQEALENHRHTPHYKAASAKFKEVLAAPPEVNILKELP